MTRFQFVADHRDAFEVKRMCQVLEISRGSFYAWQDAGPGRAQRAQDDTDLAAEIVALQDPSQGGDRAYGAPRITADLNAARGPGERINHKRVARVMRAHGLAGIRLRRKVRPAVAEPSGRKFADLIKRDFTAAAPGRRYVGDITYLPIADGSNLYLATVIDLFSRKLVGWAIADHMRTELVETALEMARAERGSLRGAVFHSDHGSVYTSKDYVALCSQLGVRQSMAAIGSSADNALAESFNATLKREVLDGMRTFPDELTAYRSVFHWVVRYNTRRRHSACGNDSPDAFEEDFFGRVADAA